MTNDKKVRFKMTNGSSACQLKNGFLEKRKRAVRERRMKREGEGAGETILEGNE